MTMAWKHSDTRTAPAAMSLAAMSLAAMSLAGSGCVVVTDMADEDDSRLSITWGLQAGDDNAPAACPPGATVAVISEPLDDGDYGLGDGDEIYDLYDCVDRAGVTGPLPPGSYDVWIDVIDESGERLLAQSNFETATLGFGELRALDYDISLDRGSFYVTWELADDVRALSCAEASAGELRVDSRPELAPGASFEDFFSCSDGQALTPGLPLGDYRVVLGLVDDKRESVAAPEVLDGAIEFGNAFVDLGHFVFTLAD
ncbi:hypothetical protein [Haliangium ochraceum]|uniref:Lipoprotein n=1 Tax=Haliangium ochraceum (strain DSM 14365 / JCM 11303 / SMP-2) TaxID=502025 RepID=D0LGN3_HALO1|nr:hypothetical protein [Haliangium ochraceum]ACY12779.1 hypothetical protein Hoch_0138 [Haliangium ochraceum DSM 14365]